MNIRFLETFVLLAELRNFRMTAERLHTTQAAISSRIASLEQEFGVRLFDRTAREVSLTPDGSKALAHAERMVKLMREMKDDMLDKHTYAGVIRIGVIESIVHSWFPEFLARLHESYPRLRIEIASDTTVHLTSQLAKGGLDLVLQGNAPAAAQIDTIPLGQLPMRWAGSPKLEIGNDLLTLSDLAAFPIVSFARESEPYAAIERMFATAGDIPLHLNGISSVATMIRLVRDGFGVAALPPAIIERELKEHTLQLLRADTALPPLEMQAAFRHNQDNPLAETIGVIAQEVAIAFANEHGQSVAIPPVIN
ncbi:LysR family transcriptional regulator [Advenella kashmirensis W13003]|uniref:LysR family transcriptional regulator n=1 Tax=Advenella kashmirensis W13003 TaxID=1424334 RepID=V8QXA9_9BURK|nr:LysR family transcriptional regulator [Advenella kashmirensis]ETF03649.1 LysR family transcriptional regulator [Advenella kashmirensis W13003]